MKKTIAIAALLLSCSAAAVPHDAAMSLSTQQRQAIESNSSLVQERLGAGSGVDFNFTPESIKWLDGYVERIRAGVDDKARLAQVLGSYFGEVIRKTYGGRWIVDQDGNIGVEIEPKFIVMPFNKVSKQLSNGSEDSIHSMFTMIPTLLTELRRKEQPR